MLGFDKLTGEQENTFKFFLFCGRNNFVIAYNFEIFGLCEDFFDIEQMV